MDGAGLFRLIAFILQNQLGIDVARSVVGISRDSCATNGVSCRQLKVCCPNAVDILCASHTLQHTGEHLVLATVEEFLTPWLTLTSHTRAAGLIWRDMMGQSMKGFSRTRWWSRWEVMKDLGTNFGQLEAFIARLRREGIGEATSQALHAIITTKGKELQLELALAMDMEILCTTTY
eukprot:scaffold285169_cov43-Tisochrysis_lutea.AAC.1